MATDTCLLAPRPPARLPARALYVGAALRDMPRNAVNTLLDRRIAVPVSVSIFGHEMTQSGLAEGGTAEVFQRRKQDSLARKKKLSSDADPRSQLFTAAASLWPSRGKVGSVLSFFLSVCLSNDEICLFLPSRTRILTSGRTVHVRPRPSSRQMHIRAMAALAAAAAAVMEVPFFFALFFFFCRISIVRLCLEPEHVRRRASEQASAVEDRDVRHVRSQIGRFGVWTEGG